MSEIAQNEAKNLQKSQKQLDTLEWVHTGFYIRDKATAICGETTLEASYRPGLVIEVKKKNTSSSLCPSSSLDLLVSVFTVYVIYSFTTLLSLPDE